MKHLDISLKNSIFIVHLKDATKKMFSLTGGLRVINNPGRKCIKTLPNMVEFFIIFYKSVIIPHFKIISREN